MPLQESHEHQIRIDTNKPEIKHSVLAARCRFKYCEAGNFITHAQTITSKISGQEYQLAKNISCRDSGVFIIECKINDCPYQMVMGCKQMYINSLKQMITLFKRYFDGDVNEKNKGMKHCLHITKDHPHLEQRDLRFEECYSVTYVERGTDDLKAQCNDWKQKMGIPIAL